MSRQADSVPLGPISSSPNDDFEHGEASDAGGKGKAYLLQSDEVYARGGGGPTSTQMRLMIGICILCLVAAIVSIAIAAAALSQANSVSSSSSSSSSGAAATAASQSTTLPATTITTTIVTSTTTTPATTTTATPGATTSTTSSTSTSTTTATATPTTFTATATTNASNSNSTTTTATTSTAITTTASPATQQLAALQANVTAVQALAQSLAATSIDQASQLGTLQANLSTLKLTTESDVYSLQTETLWFRQQMCSYNGLNFSMPLMQRISTQGAVRWTSFRGMVGETEHLAVANFRNDTTHNIQSVIYRFDMPTVQFVPWQMLNTSGATEILHFRIGEDGFLFVANAFNDTSENIKSDIYRYDRNLSQFVLFQQIDTNGARSVHAFSITNTTYLAVANYYDGTTHNVPSNIYRFDTVAQQFVLFQQLNTTGASAVESVVISGTHYLAFANFFNDTTHTLPSNIYRFDNTSNQFVLAQQIITNGASDWRAFTLNNSVFLVVANSFDGVNHSVPSILYRFDPSTSQFLFFQNISTLGARSWDHFVVGTSNFLAVAQGRHVLNNTRLSDTSGIYYFDETRQQFQLFQNITTSGAVHWHHFMLGYSNFLVLAEVRDDNSFVVGSPLYHLNRLCWNHLNPWREWLQESRALGINLETSFF